MILSGRLNKLKIPCPVALIMIINFSKVWKLKLIFGSKPINYEKMSNLALCVAALIYFQVSHLVLNKIDEHVGKPYMDEIFHVPQAQQYCVGNYTEVFYFP